MNLTLKTCPHYLGMRLDKCLKEKHMADLPSSIRIGSSGAGDCRPLLNQRRALNLEAVPPPAGLCLFWSYLSLDFPGRKSLSLDGTLPTVLDQPSDLGTCIKFKQLSSETKAGWIFHCSQLDMMLFPAHQYLSIISLFPAGQALKLLSTLSPL